VNNYPPLQLLRGEHRAAGFAEQASAAATQPPRPTNTKKQQHL